MPIQFWSAWKTRRVSHALGAALVCAGTLACKGGSTSPTSPGGPGGSPSASCRTFATTQRSVQTFVDGQVVTTDTTCALNAAGTEATCNSNYVDSIGGPGTATQTSRFASRSDIVDEAAVNPPLSRSLGTTTVVTQQGVSFTITATNAYDAQRRLVSITITNPPPLGTITTTFSAWDSSGRPTAGVTSGIPGGGTVSITYDNANRSVTRNSGLNVCTVTHDQNANMIRETCTGTTASTTIVTIQAKQQICK